MLLGCRWHPLPHIAAIETDASRDSLAGRWTPVVPVSCRPAGLLTAWLLASYSVPVSGMPGLISRSLSGLMSSRWLVDVQWIVQWIVGWISVSTFSTSSRRPARRAARAGEHGLAPLPARSPGRPPARRANVEHDEARYDPYTGEHGDGAEAVQRLMVGGQPRNLPGSAPPGQDLRPWTRALRDWPGRRRRSGPGPPRRAPRGRQEPARAARGKRKRHPVTPCGAGGTAARAEPARRDDPAHQADLRQGEPDVGLIRDRRRTARRVRR